MSDGGNTIYIGVRHTAPLEQVIKTETEVISLQLLVFYKQLANDRNSRGLPCEYGGNVFVVHYSVHANKIC